MILVGSHTDFICTISYSLLLGLIRGLRSDRPLVDTRDITSSMFKDSFLFLFMFF